MKPMVQSSTSLALSVGRAMMTESDIIIIGL